MPTANQDVVVAAPALRDFVADVFVRLDTTKDTALIVADHLVEANLKGHDSHGVGMLPAYVQNAKAGLLQVNASMRVLRDNGAVVMIDGQHGFGQRVGREAIDFAIARARDNGLVCMGLREAHHLGRIGTYGEQCAAAGMVSVHFVNVTGHGPSVSPFAGREARLVTNPFCAVVPRDDAPPIVLDMATSAVALGKVRVAYHKGAPVPEGALVDHEGRPTQDAAVLFKEPFGTLGPFGGHKGYGLAVLCELLGGALAGELTVQPDNPRSHDIVNNMLTFVLDPQATGNAAGFQAEVGAMIDYLYSCEPATGHDRVRVPGDPERESREARLAQGIPLDAGSWASIAKAATAAGMPTAAIDALAAI
ncbi:MAG: malate/lactate/ureidoglycolate dehydrogenase [Pseudomonadota bacterium]